MKALARAEVLHRIGVGMFDARVRHQPRMFATVRIDRKRFEVGHDSRSLIAFRNEGSDIPCASREAAAVTRDLLACRDAHAEGWIDALTSFVGRPSWRMSARYHRRILIGRSIYDGDLLGRLLAFAPQGTARLGFAACSALLDLDMLWLAGSDWRAAIMPTRELRQKDTREFLLAACNGWRRVSAGRKAA